ncbi:MAG: transmembrane anchor protein [Burkholderiales bacterium]|nr:transmembrane anchor protein [Burkholderiales bacterium]
MYNTDLPSRAELPSTGKLLRSTAIAALIAIGLLITTFLPSEYGIDPTGIGRALGLTQMGEIKVALSAEAKAESAAPAPQKPQAAVPAEPVVKPADATPPETRAKDTASAQQHTMTVRLKPGQGAEIKLTMSKGAAVRYEWATQGGTVNYDTHGDPVNAPKGFYHGYGKGRNAAHDTGKLQAAFDGTHGWFWRNRTKSEVTVTLKTSGDYAQIKRVL